MERCRNVDCRETFKYRKDRNRHEKEVCTKPKREVIRSTAVNGKLACSKCNRKYSCKQSFSRHLTKCKTEKFKYSKRNQQLVGSSELSFGCPVCNKRFATSWKVNNHQAIHDRVGYSCPRCATSYSRVDHFNKHVSKCKGNDETDQKDELGHDTAISDLENVTCPSIENEIPEDVTDCPVSMIAKRNIPSTRGRKGKHHSGLLSMVQRSSHRSLSLSHENDQELVQLLVHLD